MSKLSQKFYGNKKFMIDQYEQLKISRGITDEEIREIFQPYTLALENINSQNGQCTLLALFSQFIRGNLMKFFEWNFQKLSAWVELSAHVFQYSFEKHLSKKQSFEYFSQVVISHSLFRPPHSVNIFTYEEAKQIMNYWLDTFVRFYEEYRQCFEAELNEIIYTTTGTVGPQELAMADKKQISREDLIAKFGQALLINPLPQKTV